MNSLLVVFCMKLIGVNMVVRVRVMVIIVKVILWLFLKVVCIGFIFVLIW